MLNYFKKKFLSVFPSWVWFSAVMSPWSAKVSVKSNINVPLQMEKNYNLLLNSNDP